VSFLSLFLSRSPTPPPPGRQWRTDISRSLLFTPTRAFRGKVTSRTRHCPLIDSIKPFALSKDAGVRGECHNNTPLPSRVRAVTAAPRVMMPVARCGTLPAGWFLYLAKGVSRGFRLASNRGNERAERPQAGMRVKRLPKEEPEESEAKRASCSTSRSNSHSTATRISTRSAFTRVLISNLRAIARLTGKRVVSPRIVPLAKRINSMARSSALDREASSFGSPPPDTRGATRAIKRKGVRGRPIRR